MDAHTLKRKLDALNEKHRERREEEEGEGDARKRVKTNPRARANGYVALKDIVDDRMSRAILEDPEFPSALFKRGPTRINIVKLNGGPVITMHALKRKDAYRPDHAYIFEIEIRLYRHPGIDYGFVKAFQNGCHECFDILYEWFIGHMHHHLKDYPAIKGFETKTDTLLKKKKKMKAKRRKAKESGSAYSFREYGEEVDRISRKIYIKDRKEQIASSVSSDGPENVVFK